MIIIIISIIAILLSSFLLIITLQDGTNDSVISNVSTAIDEILYTEEGIQYKTSAKDIWKNMEKENSNVQKYLENEIELEKLINAEIKSLSPKIGNPKAEIDGIVEFKRHKEDGTVVMLKFINLDMFNFYISNNNIAVQNYFTIDENKNLLLGMIKETTETINTNDSEIDISEYSSELTADDADPDENGKYTKTVYDVYKMSINYREIIKKYSLPFQYLWSLIVVGDDKDVALELANIVDDSQIIVSIYDNITTTESITTNTYDKKKKVDVIADFSVGGSTTHKELKPAAEWIDGSYEVKHTITYKENTPIIDVSKADVWVVDYRKDYSYQQAIETDRESNEEDLEDTEYVQEVSDSSESRYFDKYKEAIENIKKDLKSDAESSNNQTNNIINEISNEVVDDDVDNEISNEANGDNEVTDNTVDSEIEVTLDSCTETSYVCKQKRHIKDETIVYNQKYIAQVPINNPKISKEPGEVNFVTILSNPSHYEAKFKITDEITSWLIEILESNPDTVNMVDLTKYLLYVVTERDDYGITDYDFSVFDSAGFTDVGSSIYGGSIQEKVWNMLKDLGYSDIAAAAAMGNIHYESGFKVTAIENGYTEENGGIGICQWTNDKRGPTGRNTNLKEYAISKSVNWQNEDIQVEFLKAELTVGGGANGKATYQLLTTKSYYRNELACPSAWINAESVENATAAFCYSFERPNREDAEKSMKTRIQHAEEYYSRYSGNINTELTGENKTKMQELIAEAKRIANDDRYGYSQPLRNEEFYYDCSSFVSRLYQKFFEIGARLDSGSGPRGTDNIRARCLRDYKKVPLTSLQPGDILWRSGHVALYIGNNKTAEALTPELGIVVMDKDARSAAKKFTEAYRIIY